MPKQLAITLILLFSLTSCMTSRVRSTIKASFFKESDGFIISKIEGIPPNLGYDLYEMAKQKFKNTSCKILYFPIEEYELMRNGISKDKLNRVVLSEELANQINVALGVKYYLHVERFIPPNTGFLHDDRLEIHVRFVLINLVDDRPNYEFTVTTTWIGDDTLTPTSTRTVMYIAFSKAMKKIRREMTRTK